MELNQRLAEQIYIISALVNSHTNALNNNVMGPYSSTDTNTSRYNHLQNYLAHNGIMGLNSSNGTNTNISYTGYQYPLNTNTSGFNDFSQNYSVPISLKSIVGSYRIRYGTDVSSVGIRWNP